MNEHLGGAYQAGDSNTFMPDVWGYLVVQHRVKSMLDVGCGFGHAMKWFSELLVATTGIEGWDDAIRGNLMPGQVIQHDYTKGPAPLPGTANYDLGWSAEFVEHVDEQFVPNYMADLRRCRLVCITHGEPGQNGHHHVTLKNDQFWVETFDRHGFSFLSTETALLRLTDRWKAGWGRRTLMVFRNNLAPQLDPPQFQPLEPIYPV